MARKPRSDSKLKAGLDAGQQDQLRDWMLGGTNYRKAKRLVEEEFGVSTSLAALSDFYESVCVPFLLEQRQRSAQLASALTRGAQKDGANFSEATLDLLRQSAFELMSDRNRDPKDVARILTLFLKSQDQDLSKRKVELLEQKAALAEEAEGVTGDSRLSAEEKEMRMREIFGLPSK